MSLISFVSTILLVLDQAVVPLIFAVAFITFLWGAYQYFIAGGADEEKRKQGRQFIVYSLIGFFVMLTIWGLVNLLLGSFSLNTNRPDLPSSVDTGFCLFEVLGECVAEIL